LPARVTCPPQLGEHTDTLLCDLCGVPADKLYHLPQD
jgi:hypothetical protein